MLWVGRCMYSTMYRLFVGINYILRASKRTIILQNGHLQCFNAWHTSKLLIVRDVNTRVLGYPGPVWPTRVPTRVP